MLKPLVYGLAFGLPLTKALIPSNANSYGALSLRDPLAAHSDPELGASDESDDDDMDVSDDYYEENSGEEMDLDEPEAEAEPEKPPPPLIDQAVFQQYVAKGKKLYDYMSEPNEARLTQALIKDKKKLEGGSLASRFTRYENDLTESGWKKSSRPEADFEVDVSLKPTVKGLGLSTTFRPKDPNGLNEYVSWRQNVSPFVGTDGKKHNDPKIPVTDASYTNVYNTKQGVLMMISNYGPRYELRERIEKDLNIHDPKKIKDMQESYVYPKLQHLSDVLGLEYSGQCKKNGDNPKKLDKIIGYEAQSHDAVQVMDYILKDLRAPSLKKASQYGHFQPPTWEKKLTFSAGKPEFNAILASPGGNIATFLLLQHREMFGMKRISKVDVFDDDHYDHDKDHPNFKGASKVFYLEDLDPKTGKPVDVAGAAQSKHKPPKTAPNKVVKPNNDKKKHPKGDKNNPRPGGSGSGNGAGPRPQRMARSAADDSNALTRRDSVIARSGVEMTGMDVDLGSSAGSDDDDPPDEPVLPELTDDGYRQAVAKGKKMYQWMGVTDEKILTQQLVKDRKLGAREPLQSKFVKYPGDLTKIGGLRDDQAKLDQRMSNWKDVPLKSAVKDLDISLTWRAKGQAGDHEYKTWRQTNPEFVGENGKPVDAEYATGATYSNVYNTRQGVVYFISNYGPKHELPATLDFVAADLSDEKRQQIIDNYVYPQLSHVSDVVALEYMGQAEKMGHSLKVLNKMFMFGSQSDGVVQVVDHILKKRGVAREQDPNIAGYYKAPSYAQKMTFLADSDEFHACLSTPNGGLGVFMLLQHRKQFGTKRISKIDLFNDEHELYEKTPYKGATMIFYLEDLDASGKPVAAAVEPRHSLAARADVDMPDYDAGTYELEADEMESGEEDDDDDDDQEAGDEDKPILPPLTEEQYHQAIAKGHKLYNWMGEKNEKTLVAQMVQDGKLKQGEGLQSKFVNYPKDLANNGWIKHQETSVQPSWQVELSFEAMVKDLGISMKWRNTDPTGPNELVNWLQAGVEFTSLDGKKVRNSMPTTATHTTMHNTAQGMIGLLSGYGPKHMLQERLDDSKRSEAEKKKIFDEYKWAELYHFSDIAALEYLGQCNKYGDDPKKLDKMLMWSSQSDHAVIVDDYILKKHGVQPAEEPTASGLYVAPDWKHKLTFVAGTPDFNAILGTPNGWMASFILLQNRGQFGIKRISKIDLFRDDHDKTDPQDSVDPYKGASMMFYLEDISPSEQAVAGSSGSGGSASSRPGPQVGGRPQVKAKL